MKVFIGTLNDSAVYYEYVHIHENKIFNGKHHLRAVTSAPSKNSSSKKNQQETE